ncbi:hypothetical protein SAMN04488004_103243 [Loktanella salsilacus]|uniref:Replication initiator protein A n=1 Tax=Loktanella salsilacus TaxID=195913 RepID=A0A1I4D7C1_9RHOB|nr:hypothetical protein [Loktanella salsilacus]SFK88710.1 hypothetical protein SAMN04488004_103243 [Loktanella salsilacus]
MPLDNGKVMVPWPLAEQILAAGFNAPTLRLVFSMLHQLDLRGVGGPDSQEVCPVIWASCADLRERIGPHGGKSAREIRDAAEAFVATGLVEKIALLDKSKNLQWQFSPWIWDAMRMRDLSDYVLIDLNALGSFRSTFRIQIYLVAQKCRGSNAPQFYVAYDFRKSEEANVRLLISALKAVAEVLNLVCYTALELCLDKPEPDRFKVKLVHPKTKWRKHSYMKFKRAKAIWRVGKHDYNRFDPRTVRDKRADLVKIDDLGLDQQVIAPA